MKSNIIKFEGAAFYQFCRQKIKDNVSILRQEWIKILQSTSEEDCALRNKFISLSKIDADSKRRRRCLIMDAYFIFAVEYRKEIALLFPEWGSKRITIELFHQWKCLPIDMKDEYISEAEKRYKNKHRHSTSSTKK